MDNNNKPKIVFAPGCFDHLDLTQEELDNLISELTQAVESGEFFDQGQEITDEEFDLLPEEIKAQILEVAQALDTDQDLPNPGNRTLH